MSDTMQEEFEAEWRKSHASDEGVESNGPTRSKTQGKDYAGGAAEFAWMWWQRSSVVEQARIAALVEALHGISLVSKNSMSGKEECGRLAREALSAHRQQAAVPSEWVMVLAEPAPEHIDSIAMRIRHDFGLLPEYLKEQYRADARQMYEESTGQGFYKIAATSQADGVNQGETK